MKHFIHAILAVLLLVAGAVACSGGAAQPEPTVAAPTNAPAATEIPPTIAVPPPIDEPAADQGTTVTVQGTSFTPRELTISAGSTVSWVHGGGRHTVTAEDGSFDTPMEEGSVFDFQFDEPGTYAYYCRIHGGPGQKGMSGVIVVNP